MNTDNNTSKRRNGLGAWFVALAKVFRREWRLIFTDPGAILFFIALPLAYPVVYTLIYNPEVVRQMPVAVVDYSRTAQSRELVRTMSAAPAIDIYAQCANMDEAKDLFGKNEVFAIVEIPRDYAKKLGRGETATVPMYFEMSLLLRYRAFLTAFSDVQLKMVNDVTQTRLMALGAGSLGLGMPVESHNTFLGDPGQGFASFVMPGVLMLILQQSMVLGICLIGGTSNERRRRNGGIDPKLVPAPASATVWGKTLCYFVLYIPLSIYVAAILPEMFSLPHAGAKIDYLLFLVPYLLGSAMFGQALSGLCTERESGFIVVVFTSIIFLFLSGLTWPRYAMSPFWVWLGNLVPATWGVEGFIRINSNAATLVETAHPFHMLWILTVAYFLVAWGVLWVLNHTKNKRLITEKTI